MSTCTWCVLSSPGATGCSARLWEDKMLAGFTPLSSSFTSDELFSICDAHQLTAEVHWYTHTCRIHVANAISAVSLSTEMVYLACIR